MTLTVWDDDWQIQCCGQSFASEDVVSWTLLEVDPEEYADVVGSERADEIDFREEHHGQPDRWAKARPDVSFAGYLVTARRATDGPEGAAACGR
ncbi:hypothetical protein ELQ39_21080 [Streptomyces sp. GB4-14]|uniref:DUF6578 domain-containing protein n=1 Tax=Streptomyces sp. GB4-14 TaxID=2498703 RepID=UPI001F5E920D|nr:hypothetical protein [Streptomyces sp. GB4-14]